MSADTGSDTEPGTAGVAFSQREFRSALGLFPTGVTVITALASDGERLGITVSSFNSVSLDPPSVLFSVARSSHSLKPLEMSEGYAVNVLRQGQMDVSNRFARAHEKSWDGVGYREGVSASPVLASPVLDGAAVVFQCVPHATHDGGDHVIFVGRVVSFQTRGASDPLVFYNGAYREPRGPMENMQHYDALMLHGW